MAKSTKAPTTPKASKAAKATEPEAAEIDTGEPTRLSLLLKKARAFRKAQFWIIGMTPLIVHAWSEKARREMLSKQLKSVKPGREARDPEEDFQSSLYEMGNGGYGFPVTGVKKSILRAAHKEKGIPRQSVLESLFLKAEMVSVRPALAGAICDMPLVRVWGDKPQMREDMVKIGSGLNKTATLAYRGQFKRWAIKIEAEINPKILTPEALMFLVEEGGMASGIGEWRNERNGVFGAYRMANEEEENAWEKFAANNGKGAVPYVVDFQEREAAE